MFSRFSQRVLLVVVQIEVFSTRQGASKFFREAVRMDFGRLATKRSFGKVEYCPQALLCLRSHQN